MARLDLSAIEMDVLSRGRCPQCACDDWIAGPRGGAAQNFECNGCHRRYNVTIWRGQLIAAEHIGHRDSGGNWAAYYGTTPRPLFVGQRYDA